PHIVLTEWAKKYGTIFQMKLFNEEIVVLNDYMSIYEGLVMNGTALSGRPPMYRTAQNERNEHSIVWQTYTSKLIFLRKHVHQSFKMYGQGLEQLEYKCKSEIKELIQRFESNLGSKIDPQYAIYDSVCNVMMELILGTKEDKEAKLERVKELNVAFNEVFGSGSSRKIDFIPWLRRFGSREQTKLMEALKLRDDIWNKEIKILLKSNNNQEEGVIQSLLNKRHDSNCQDINITENTAKEVFTNLILAGTDTTATALTSLLLIFLNYPEVQDRMFQEISSVIGTETSPSLHHRESLSYCEAVLLELLRYLSHVPLAVPHYSIENTAIGGKNIPAGLTVYINLWALHHDESIWNSPWMFDPERFLDSRGQIMAPGSIVRRRLMVFGAGRRVCLGETLAKNRLFLFVTSLVQKLKFTHDTREELPNCDPRTFDMGLVLHPKPFKLMVSSRD
ncbi:hypothetical protein LOTGIDRAFT_63600, partial [Lottia gigantea]